MSGSDANAPRWLNDEGSLLLGRTPGSSRYFYPPHAIAPGTLEPTVSEAASGRGTIYSYSVVRRPDVYVLAFVTLEEGPTMLTNIVDCDVESLEIGQAVALNVRAGPQGPMPSFTPV